MARPNHKITQANNIDGEYNFYDREQNNIKKCTDDEDTQQVFV